MPLSPLVLRRLGAAAVIACAALQAYAAGIDVERPRARSTVAGQPAGGAFLTVKNAGSAPDKLIGASAPTVAERVELHTMTMDGDVMRMRQIDAVDVPAGGSVALEPGKQHLMLMGLKAPLQAGSRFPLTLKFEKAGDVKVDVAVEPAAGAPAAAHDHAGHKH